MTEAQRLIDKHRQNGVLIDSNLFVLYVIGTTNESRVERFNRTQQYTLEDYWKLRDFVLQFDKVVTTPHVLTEVSNLAALGEPELRQMRSNFGRVVQETREIYEASQEIVVDATFPKFGLTDAGISRVAARPVLV